MNIQYVLGEYSAGADTVGECQHYSEIKYRLGEQGVLPESLSLKGYEKYISWVVSNSAKMSHFYKYTIILRWIMGKMFKKKKITSL